MALRKLWKEQPNGPAMKYFETDENLKKVLESVQDIDFEALLRDKENLGIFISLFEHADPEEKEKMKEQIVWYFSELFEKNQDISFLIDIAGGDVLEANSSLTTFLKEQARKTLMARKIYDSLSIVYADV